MKRSLVFPILVFRSAVAATDRSYTKPKNRGGDRERQAATSAGATERGYPVAERGYPTPEVRGSGHEEQPRPRSCAVWAEEG